MAKYTTLIEWSYEPKGNGDNWRRFLPGDEFQYPDSGAFSTKLPIDTLTSDNVIKEADNG
jgi:hypothetical protein